MQVLTDTLWTKFEVTIGIRDARPCKDDRRTIEAIVCWHHVYLLFRGWTVSGVWDKIHGACGGCWRAEAGVCLHRRDGGAGTPEGGWSMPVQTDMLSLQLTRKNGENSQALGRSRSGFIRKIVGVCDAAGRLVDFVLVSGQAHELAASWQLLKRLPKEPAWALADMACDAAEFRSTARAMSAIPVVPSRKNAKQPQPCPDYIYRHRNLIECCWSCMKERRAIATRYDKTATSYAAGMAIAAKLDWFKSSG